MTVVFFVVSGLDLLKDESLDLEQKQHIIEWIYGMQLENNNKCLEGLPGTSLAFLFETKRPEQSRETEILKGNKHIESFSLSLSLRITQQLSELF
jgi:hypothetical protein